MMAEPRNLSLLKIKKCLTSSGMCAIIKVEETKANPNQKEGSDNMVKIDRRRHYILVVDTETANTLVSESGRLDMSNVLVYDCGWQVIDTHGNVYKSQSWVNREIFVHERELMQSAYYADKIPRYIKDLQEGKRQMGDFWEIRRAIIADMEEYNIHEVAAHNARFDINALNVTRRWLTKSKWRYFFPYGTEIWDTMKMARSVICKMPTYQRFCTENGYITKNNQLRVTAEILWRFISKDNQFKESHTGLEDVAIESQILAYCYRQHKPMKKVLYAGMSV